MKRIKTTFSGSGRISFNKNLARALALGSTLATAVATHAGTVFKADNSDDLNLGSSWVGGLAPTNTDIAAWDSTVTGANTTLLATNTTWAGLKISNPAGLVTINSTSTNANAGATLTLGASGLDLSTASQDLTFGAPVGLLAATAQNWSIGTRILTLNGGLVRASTGNSGTLNFDTSLGGTVNIATGTASALLLAGNAPFATVNRVDFASLDGSKNVVAGSAFYGDYNAGGSISGTYASPVVNVTGTSAGATQAFRLSNNLTVPNGVRFDVANNQNSKWTIDTASSGRLLTTGAILIGPDVGNQNVEIGGPGGVRANGNSQDLVLFQNNPFGDLVFNVSINPATGPSASPLVKTGPGRVILAVANSYTGPTRVEQGTLIVNGSINASSAVTVNSGATFGGAGTNFGPVTVTSGGTLAPGNTNGMGSLLIGGALTFNAGTSSLNFYSPLIPTTNTTPLLNLTNGLVVNGTVNVSILSGSAAVGQYPLVKWTNAIPGATFSAFNLAFLPPHVAGFLSNNAANSTIDLVITNVSEPLTWATGGGAWDINTSANWKDSAGNATTYQQVGTLADTVVFEDTQSGSSPITVTLNASVVPPAVAVNGSKNYTISGSGGIGGVGALTKQGSGTLTLGTANSFKAGLNLNGGTVVFSSLTNLGGGVLNFGGGALQFASGNTDDISTRTVTFGPGGATINDGGNTLYFANPIGNGGAGNFTKTGPGNLTLNGTNNYTGTTVVDQGTLTLAGSTYISNSPVVIIHNGAILDVTQNGTITLSTPVAQSLYGNGTVNGGLILPVNTTISPATNGVVGTFNVSNGDVTFSGGTYVCDVTASTRDLLNISGSIVLTSGKLQLNVTGTLANGRYKLIQYGGSIMGGSAGNLTLSGFSQAGKAATLSDSVPGEIDLVVADTANDNLKWSGNAGSTWDLTATLNWLNGATPWAFTNGDAVTFDDTGASGFVSLQAAVRPASVTVNNNTLAYTMADGTGTGAGKISGSTALVKDGPGLLVIDTVNDNTGGLTINNGTLQVGDGSTTGDIGTGNVTNNASLIFAQTDSRTVSGVISGTGALTQQGTSTLILAQNNTYTGPTTINSGTLQIGTGTGVGTVGPAAITNNGALVFNRSGTFAVNNGVAGTGGLTFNGAATVTLGGVNSYSGTTAVGAGTTVKLAASGVIPTSGAGNNNVNITGKLDLNGFDQTVSRLNGSGTIVNDAGTATNFLTIDYDGTGTADTSVVMADNDGTGGKLTLVKTGTGSQIIRGASTFTGGTIVSNGTLNVRGATALSTGPVILRGGNLSFASLTIANAIRAETNATLDSPGSANMTLTGDLTGSNITVFIDNNETWSWNGGASQLIGVTNFTITGGPGFFRFQGSPGSTNTTFDMTGSTVTMNSQAGNTFQVGALIGDSGANLAGASGATFIIGGKNLSTTFGGSLATSAVNNNLVKSGTGTFTLSGPNFFTGTTTVSNGVLALTGSTTLDNNSGVNVRAGGSLDVSQINGGILNIGNIANQTLSGSGTVLGSVTATGAGIATINPGDAIGTLTITNMLTLAGNSVVNMELNRTNVGATNDMLVAQSIVGNGTLNVTNIGSGLMNGDTFKLFNQAVTGFTTINLPSTNAAGGAYVWNTNITVDGSIQLVSGGVSPVNTTPTNLVFGVSGGQLTLSWPADHTGWRLQGQTNAPGVGINSSNWFDVSGANATNQVMIPVGSTNGSVFYRMVYP